MPKLIVRRLLSVRSSMDSLRNEALTAVRTLPGVTSASPVLESDEAVRIEFSWHPPRYDLVESHLNRCGLTSTG
jgi:hypothetical protein